MGFKPAHDTVQLTAGDSAYWNFQLAVAPQMLDSVHVQSEQRKTISPGLRGFEERRASGFGRFITEADLRKHDYERGRNGRGTVMLWTRER